MQRLGRVRVGPHVLDREVGRDVGVREGEEGDAQQRELGERGGLGRRPSGARRRCCAPQAGSAVCTRATASARIEREMAELDDHDVAQLPHGASRKLRSARFRAAAAWQLETRSPQAAG